MKSSLSSIQTQYIPNTMQRGGTTWGRFGAMLALIIAITPIWWIHTGARKFLLSSVPPICWPTFENCGFWRFTSLHTLDFVFITLGIGGLISAILLWFKPAHKISFFSLMIIFVFKILLTALDYRLRGNHHQMANIVTLIFLLVPKPAPTFALLIPSFYFAAGLLKINMEWLSGAALADRLPLSGWLLEWSLIAVVLMELIGIWWLLDRRRSPFRFWTILVVLLVFHVISIKSVSFFYPIVMAALISCFLWENLDWPLPNGPIYAKNALTIRSSIVLYVKNLMASEFHIKLAWFLSVLFIAIQFIPTLISSRNDLTAEGRLVASSMVQNRSECRGFMLARSGLNEIQIPMPVMNLPIRIWCDPLLFYNHARQVCRELKPDQLDWYLMARNTSESAYKLIIQANDFCRDDRSFPWLGKLPWRAE